MSDPEKPEGETPDKPWDEQLAEAKLAADGARARLPAAAPSSPVPLGAMKPSTPNEDIATLGARLIAHAEKAEALRLANLPHTSCDDCQKPLRGAHLCRVCKQTRADVAREAARIESIPERFRWALFGATELRERVPNPQAIQAAMRAVDAPWAVLVGRTGLGKTSLAAAMMRAWLEKHPVWETAYFAIGSKVQHGFARGEPEVVARARKSTLLVLDELPSQGPPWSYGVITDVLYERHAEGRATWVTTWMDAEEVRLRYDAGLTRRLFEDPEPIDCGVE